MDTSFFLSNIVKTRVTVRSTEIWDKIPLSKLLSLNFFGLTQAYFEKQIKCNRSITERVQVFIYSSIFLLIFNHFSSFYRPPLYHYLNSALKRFAKTNSKMVVATKP